MARPRAVSPRRRRPPSASTRTTTPMHGARTTCRPAPICSPTCETWSDTYYANNGFTTQDSVLIDENNPSLGYRPFHRRYVLGNADGVLHGVRTSRHRRRRLCGLRSGSLGADQPPLDLAGLRVEWIAAAGQAVRPADAGLVELRAAHRRRLRADRRSETCRAGELGTTDRYSQRRVLRLRRQHQDCDPRRIRRQRRRHLRARAVDAGQHDAVGDADA